MGGQEDSQKLELLQLLKKGRFLIRVSDAYVIYGYGGKLGTWGEPLIRKMIDEELLRDNLELSKKPTKSLAKDQTHSRPTNSLRNVRGAK